MKLLFFIAGVVFVSLFGFDKPKSEQAFILKTDTLQIIDMNKIKYVQVGTNVYQISSPTLIKVEPPAPNVWHNGLQFLNPMMNTTGADLMPVTTK